MGPEAVQAGRQATCHPFSPSSFADPRLPPSFSPPIPPRPASQKSVKKSVKKTEGKVKFTLDLFAPVDDKVLDPAAFEKFLKDRIKWGKVQQKGSAVLRNKAGDYGDKVSISRDKAKLTVTAEKPFSKRYLKYLTKKYLKKEQLKDFLHVVASTKGTYELKYYKVEN